MSDEQREPQEWRVQFNVKSGDHLINVRGNSAGDVLGELDMLAQLSDEVDKAVTGILAMECLKSGRVHAGAGSNGGAAGQGGAGQSGGAAGGKTCIHGQMTYRTGTGARGPWQAYFCPQPKGSNDACKAIFLNG